ncbi:Cytochrome b5-like Heme/Steroid binding domain containing protein, putative [Angomonas deanei]|uniref:Cytochrome b5-like Heme/Steroid binding domain containing protein, putative n=1 Tax=Angomonas deanei TaxID=59799 RepID=A0A7G2CP20_9TRYP|nr:Cytochrome b5-like Heme/Steroid binding domain containing protein, putative [Angomonas deanei]
MSNAELGNMYSKFRKPKNQSTGPTTTHSWRDNASYNEGTRDFLASAKHYQCPPSRLYTRAEVALHNRSDDLWVVIFGNVLDVTSFVKRHPGGSVLLDGAGGHEMGTVFAQFHHPSTVGLFASFCIGRIVP